MVSQGQTISPQQPTGIGGRRRRTLSQWLRKMGGWPLEPPALDSAWHPLYVAVGLDALDFAQGFVGRLCLSAAVDSPAPTL